MMLDGTTFWWEHLFRFTPTEFFDKLVPILHLPNDLICEYG